MAIENTTPQAQPDSGLSRRSAIRTAAVAGAVVVTGTGLAACSKSDNGATTGSAPGSAASDPGAAGSAGGGASTGAGAGGGAAGSIAKTSDIPVGGGKIIATQKIVVTQPAAGKFEAFSALCTHQGCAVNQISNGSISCPCHGSKFSVKDGSVQAGPAPAPLTKVNVKVQGEDIVQA